jgi:hypothetical protein
LEGGRHGFATRMRSIRVPQLLLRAPVAVFQQVKALSRLLWNHLKESSKPPHGIGTLKWSGEGTRFIAEKSSPGLTVSTC